MPRPAPAILALVVWLLVASTAASPQEPLFRVDVRLVRVLATVRNPSGELVGNLSKDNFTIL